jgi:hypothetical protein
MLIEEDVERGQAVRNSILYFKWKIASKWFADTEVGENGRDLRSLPTSLKPQEEKSCC